MIGRLKGKIAAIDEDTALIDVQGVGYETHAHSRLLGRMQIGDDITVSIETIVREDLIRLYAFETEAERRAFRLLQSVQGVGARHALSILQVLPPADLYDAIAAEDVTALSRANGVGKKIAQRVAVELQSKLGALAPTPSGGAFKVEARAQQTAAASNVNAALADAVSALVNLGYDSIEARRAVKRASDEDESAGVEDLIKAGLKELAIA